jgi:hypothetical protein
MKNIAPINKAAKKAIKPPTTVQPKINSTLRNLCLARVTRMPPSPFFSSLSQLNRKVVCLHSLGVFDYGEVIHFAKPRSNGVRIDCGR